ncbi:hypothetical protein AGMMS49950_10810 [Endomicrobiia bacterium]|nr:hypothetical protein AGMMS49950_10810 [Endomicrobiia bacterium]
MVEVLFGRKANELFDKVVAVDVGVEAKKELVDEGEAVGGVEAAKPEDDEVGVGGRVEGEVREGVDEVGTGSAGSRGRGQGGGR